MQITIHGIAKAPKGRGYIEVASVHESQRMISCQPTGAWFRTQAEGVRITAEKNIAEAARMKNAGN